MLVYSDRLNNVPVLSLQTGSPLATTSTPLIDPRRLHVIAFYCEGPLVDVQPAVLHTTDIREFSDIGIIVDGSDNIMSPEGLVRLQEIIDFDFPLIGMKVIDNHQKKIGKVYDYTVETESFIIKKLSIKRPLLQSLNDTELLIDREQIIEITHDTIIVRAPSVEVRHTEAIQHQFVNPFRKTDPQTEGHPSSHN